MTVGDKAEGRGSGTGRPEIAAVPSFIAVAHLPFLSVSKPLIWGDELCNFGGNLMQDYRRGLLMDWKRLECDFTHLRLDELK